jgi:hypothetical protein
MKSSSVNSNCSLYNVSNYNKKLDADISTVQHKYIKIIVEYLKYVIENLKIKNISYSKFIIIRGIETVHHVFYFLLFYTNNLDITYFHAQKAVYFYIEFIQQTSTDENIFLQLSSRDATMYVYRKTIFEINNECRKNYNNTLNRDLNEKWEIITKYSFILKNIIINFINKNEFYHDSKENEYINDFKHIGNLIVDKKLTIIDLNNLEIFIDKLNIKSLELTNYKNTLLIFVNKIN